MQKEIIVFTEGDSSDSSVWSNIPYFLTKTLEKQGFKIHRINVEGPSSFIFLYNKIFRRVLKLFYNRNTTYSYNRSKLFSIYVNYKMKMALKKYPDFYCTISTSYSFAPSQYTTRPTVLICDWTYDFYFKHFLKRKPDYWEAKEIARQNDILEQASLIIPLSPDIAINMQSYYKNPNITYLGSVINCDSINMKKEKLYEKYTSHRIVFIGIKKYIEGALCLIQAINSLNRRYANIQLDIIGMNHEDFDFLPSNVKCHGYLNKSNPEHLSTYSSLLQNATIYVNTTPEWAAPSATLEALYNYLPIITTPYSSIVEVLGETITFGSYCSDNSPDTISSYIQSIFDLSFDDYSSLCTEAHQSVQNYTWDNYIKKIMMEISQL